MLSFSINRGLRVLVLILLLVPAAVPLLADEHSATADAEASVDFLGLRAVMPAGWQRGQPTSSMRLAQFTTTDAEADQSAEIIF